MSLPGYVLITPVRNEAKHIGLMLDSVVAQTIRPRRWVIISDGSTDGTDEIVTAYAARHRWIELVRLPERRERHFSGKVHAFNAGYDRVKGLDYEVIASLDGDISFDVDYFEFLLQRLAADHQLGLVGTPFHENGKPIYDFRFVNIEHVSGACQVFRRQCFEDIGGYKPMRGGGIDYLAVLTARMKGWKTRTFTEMVCHHHREMGTAGQSALKSRFKYGIKDYVLGSHPVWQLFRMFYQMSKRPYVVGGLAVFAGYTWSSIRVKERPVSREVIAFRRREEMERLRRFLTRTKTMNSRLDLPAGSGVTAHD